MNAWVGGKRASAAGGLRRFQEAEIEPARSIGLSDVHAAALEGRTIFPTTVVASADSPRLLVSGANNPKLGGKVTKGPRKGWPVYQLTLEERATCPSSCRMWQGCMGNAMHMARRHAADENLIPLLGAELAALNEAHPKGFLVRLHTLGDFYSVEYVAAWGAFIDRFPALHVFGYTARRSPDPIGYALEVVIGAAWSRFAIRFSHDLVGEQRAVVFDADPQIPEVIMCPAQTQATETCGTCGLCWADSARPLTIGFLRHGMKRGRTAMLTDEGREAMREFAQECCEGRTWGAALEVFVNTMYDNEGVAGFIDDFIGDAVAAKARDLIYSIKAVSGAVTPNADGEVQQRLSGTRSGYGSRSDAEPQQVKPLADTMLVRWGASVAAGFNFTLPDGSKLGDATHRTLAEAALKYQAFGKEAHQKARWLTLIAQGLPEGQTVRERFKPLRLTELAIEAEKSERAKVAADD